MIMNGDMRVQQRAVTGWLTTRFDYVTDRFASYQSENELQVQKSLICLFAWAIAVRNTAGNDTLKGITQAIELDDPDNTTNPTQAPFVAGANYTVSWWAVQRDDTAIPAADFSISLAFRNAIDNSSNASSGMSNVGPITQIDDVPSTGWRRFKRTFVIDTAANAGNKCMTLRLGALNGTSLSGADGVLFTGIQLEKSSNASDFERRPVALELEMCKRYYQDDKYP